MDCQIRNFMNNIIQICLFILAFVVKTPSASIFLVGLAIWLKIGTLSK